MSKHKGALRYTDKATGRPVFDMPKDMLGAALGQTRSHTARRAEERYMNNVNGAGKGDMRRPSDKAAADKGWLVTFCDFYTKKDVRCTCIECRNGRLQ